MKIELDIPDSLADKLNASSLAYFERFLQWMVNRRVVGALRYEGPGGPDRRNQYMRRLSLELRKYRKSGNFEQLLNIANYAFLESSAPQHPHFHFDPESASATRGMIEASVEESRGA